MEVVRRLLVGVSRGAVSEPPGQAFMPRKALYHGLGRHSLVGRANPASPGWPVGGKCLPRGPMVKGTVE